MKTDVQLNLSADETVTANNYDRKKKIAKLIAKELAVTNWKLMNDGISSRMGIITIRLRGFDNEDAIKKLVESRLKKEELKLPNLAFSGGSPDGTLVASDGSIVTL